MENATFEKPNSPRRKISYSFLYYVKDHRCDVMKNLQICRSLASCISRKLSSDQSEPGMVPAAEIFFGITF